MFEIELSHNFETAHRLATETSPEKCRSIHGHSWWVTVTIRGEDLDDDGILVEFGAFKKAWRTWLDGNLDHHLVLAKSDPLLAVLREFDADMRLFVCEGNPTTEVLARLISVESSRILAEVPTYVSAEIHCVHLQETRVNSASYYPAR